MGKKNKAGYTATEVACGWAGAVMKHADSSVWAGAVLQKTPENAEKGNGDRWTNRPAQRVIKSCSTRLKKEKKEDKEGERKIK